MDVRMPDGTVITNVPEGTTQTDLLRRYSAHQDIYRKQAEADSPLQNFTAAVGGAAAGVPLAVREMLGKTQPGEVEDWKKAMAGLWSTNSGKVGTVVGGAAAAAPAILIPGANTALGAAGVGAAYGALQPVGDEGSRLTNAAIGGAGGVAGKYAGDLLAKGVSSLVGRQAASAAAKQEANAVRDSTIREAQQAGYVFPPNLVQQNASNPVNRVLEGISGKIQTAQAAAIKNQAVTNRLARQELGLPDSVPLTSDTLNKVREVAGEAYKQLKTVGPMTADDAFRADLNNVIGDYRSLVQEFPSQRIPTVEALIADVNKPEITSSSLVELVKRLRSDGFKNVKAQEPERVMLGRVQLGVQDALENLTERNLAAGGNADFLPVFQNARRMIAKTYSVEKALEDSTGNVVASKLGRQYSSGKPLSGNLEKIGKVAEAFPKMVQNMNTSMPGITAVDAITGAITGTASGNPLAAALPLARQPIRSMILSEPYQRMMVQPPTYGPGLLGRLEPALTSESTKRLLELLGPGAALAVAP